MTKHASYIFQTYSTLLNLSLDQLLQLGRNQSDDPNPIPSFDENLLINLCSEARSVFEQENIILEIDDDTIVVGDIHGSFHDLLRILNYIQSDKSRILFLGDYVDRGSFSIECITILFALKVSFPEKYFLLRGNHEFDAMCSHYGFKKEILNYHNPKKPFKIEIEKDEQTFIPDHNYINFEEEEEEKEEEISHEQRCDNYIANHENMNCYKYTEKLYKAFLEAFAYLPICAIVNKTSICIHGGLSPLLDRVEKINLIQRPIHDFDDNLLLSDLLWGDPSGEISRFYEKNPRGRGKLFSGIAVVKFLKQNNFQHVIRAHQCINEGTDFSFNNKCITVFSSSSYDHDLGNNSGILKIFKNSEKIEPINFDPLHHLVKTDAIYYKVQPLIKHKVPHITISQDFFQPLNGLSQFPPSYNNLQTKSQAHFNGKEKESFPLNSEDSKLKSHLFNNPNHLMRITKLRPPSFINYRIHGNKIAFNSGNQIINNRRSSLVPMISKTHLLETSKASLPNMDYNFNTIENPSRILPMLDDNI